MTNAILSEYQKLIAKYNSNIENLKNAPQGYISKKNINGKVYCYLQKRVGGKVAGRYLKADEVSLVQKQIADAKTHKVKIALIVKRLEELETAAKLIDVNLNRQLSLTKLTNGLDNLPQEQKERSISFAGAMNAIEGVPASSKANIYIDEWKNGGRTYLSAFEDVLKMYGLSLEVENA